jgi:thiamine-phosphate pyrophosphorylase
MRSVLFTDRKKISDFAGQIQNLPKNSAIIIREYDLSKNEREVFAREIFKLAKKRSDLKILIGKDLKLAQKLKAHGVHFSDFDLLPIQFLNKKSFPKNFIFSFSCHSEKSLKKAAKIDLDMVFISPIFTTTSHNEAKTLGILNLAKISTQNKKQNYCRHLPLFALGGINKKNIKALKKLKLKGFGAIDYFLSSQRSCVVN